MYMHVLNALTWTPPHTHTHMHVLMYKHTHTHARVVCSYRM